MPDRDDMCAGRKKDLFLCNIKWDVPFSAATRGTVAGSEAASGRGSFQRLCGGWGGLVGDGLVPRCHVKNLALPLDGVFP